MAYRQDICMGCGKIMRSDEPYREQRNGRERYCLKCNKIWTQFQIKAQPIYDEADAWKEEKLAKLKKEHYGEPVYDNDGRTYRDEEKKVVMAENVLTGGNANVDDVAKKLGGK